MRRKKRQKAADVEFTEEQLPHNRRQQFFDCTKVRFTLFLQAGLILLLFLVPCIILGVYRDFTLIGFAARLKAGEITRDMYDKMQTSVNLVISAINIVCLVIASLGVAGIVRVFRRLVWGEAVFFKQDFIAGIKANGKSYTLIFFLSGVVCFIDNLVASFQFPSELVKYIPWGISIVLLLPIALFVLAQTLIYTNKAGVLLKNSGVLYIKSAPVTILFLLVLVLPAAAQFIPLVFVKFALYVLLIVLALPFYIFALLLYDVSLFDRFINREQYPELYKRGIYNQS